MSRKFLLFALALSTIASATDRWVPPPSPPVVDATPVLVDKESFGQGRLVIHLHKPEQTDARKTIYHVELSRTDDHPFFAVLSTHWFNNSDEVVFLTVPAGDVNKYTIEVVDYTYTGQPFKRVFKGTLNIIPEIK